MRNRFRRSKSPRNWAAKPSRFLSIIRLPGNRRKNYRRSRGSATEPPLLLAPLLNTASRPSSFTRPILSTWHHQIHSPLKNLLYCWARPPAAPHILARATLSSISGATREQVSQRGSSASLLDYDWS